MKPGHPATTVADRKDDTAARQTAATEQNAPSREAADPPAGAASPPPAAKNTGAAGRKQNAAAPRGHAQALDAAKVRIIRLEYGSTPLAKLARDMKVSETAVVEVANRRTWRHIPPGPGEYVPASDIEGTRRQRPKQPAAGNRPRNREAEEKLTADDARAVRRALKNSGLGDKTISALSTRFGVSDDAILDIAHRRAWRALQPKADEYDPIGTSVWDGKTPLTWRRTERGRPRPVTEEAGSRMSAKGIGWRNPRTPSQAEWPQAAGRDARHAEAHLRMTMQDIDAIARYWESELALAGSRDTRVPTIASPIGRTWIWSDLHLGDRGPLEAFDRPFADVPGHEPPPCSPGGASACSPATRSSAWATSPTPTRGATGGWCSTCGRARASGS